MSYKDDAIDWKAECEKLKAENAELRTSINMLMYTREQIEIIGKAKNDILQDLVFVEVKKS